MQISGALSAEPASGRMNGLALPQLQMKRVVAWRQVLFKKNAERFNSLKRTGNHLIYNGFGYDQKRKLYKSTPMGTLDLSPNEPPCFLFRGFAPVSFFQLLDPFDPFFRTGVFVTSW